MDTLRLRSILASEGLVRTASMSDAEGWAVANLFKDATTYGKQEKVVKEYRDAYKAQHGAYWPNWVSHVKEFRDWFWQTAGKLQRAMYAWQETPEGEIIIPSDDGMGDWAKQLTLLGKSVYDAALSDPGLIPRLELDKPGPYGPPIRGSGRGYYNKGKISPQVDKALTSRQGSGWNPFGWPEQDSVPRGWSDNPLKFMTYAELPSKARQEYAEGLVRSAITSFVPEIPGQRFWHGYPAKGFQSNYWEFYWAPVERRALSTTDKGADIPFELVAFWTSNVKSLKKADLIAALHDTQKAFRGILKLSDKADSRDTLEEVVREMIRKKNSRPKTIRTSMRVSTFAPLMGKRNWDWTSLKRALSKSPK